MLKYQIVPVTAFQQNCSLVWDDETRQAAVVDPGGDLSLILQAAKELDLKLEQIWATHAHIDHVGAVGDLAKQLNLPVFGPHREDEFLINALPEQSMSFNFPLAHKFTPTKWLDDGDKVQIGNETLSVYHTPGHTPGHVVFYAPQAKVAFVGDVLFAGSIGRTDFPRGNYEALINSIKTKLLTLDDDTTFVPGHGPESTIGQERVSNPFLLGA